jgi:hypothetical protein
MRRVRGCINCGEEREIVAFGLCSMCYMRHRRAEESARLVPDRSQRKYIAERTKQLQSLIKLISLVNIDLAEVLSDEDAAMLKSIVHPYAFERVMQLNAAAEPDDESTDNEGDEVNGVDSETVIDVNAVNGEPANVNPEALSDCEHPAGAEDFNPDEF